MNDSVVPKFVTPDERAIDPGALVFWTEEGIGLWVHPKALRFLPSISRLEMMPAEWQTVAVVVKEWPLFIASPAQW